MEEITRVLCLLLLIGFTRSGHPNSNTAALDSLYKRLDDSADPCENFQTFSSGKFGNLHPNNPLIKDLGGSINHESDVKMQIVLEELRNRFFIDESSVEGKALRFYEACLTASPANQRFFNYLEVMSPAEDLPWPTSRVSNSWWPSEKFQWLDALARLRRFGIENLLFRMNVVQDWYDPNKFVVYLKRPKYPTIPMEGVIRNVLALIGVPKKHYPHINGLVAGINNLEDDLLNLPPEENKSYILSIEKFEDQTGIQLSKYLEISFGRPFDASLEVKIEGMRYLEGLKAVIESYRKEVVATYMIMGIVSSLNRLKVAPTDGFNSPEECAGAVRRHMELASELLYKDYYFRQGRLQRYNQEVQQLFELLRGAFLERVERNRLNLTAEEQSFVKQKVLALKVQLGSLPNVPNQRRFVNDFYSDLELDKFGTNVARIQLNILEHFTRHTLKQLDRPTPNGNHFFLLEEYDYSLNAEPHYKTSNLVVVPYGILQEPYFSLDQHDVFKVSLLGFSIIRAALSNFRPFFMRFDNESNYSDMMDNFKENLAYVEATTCLSRYDNSADLDDQAIIVAALQLVYDLYFGEDSKFSQKQPNFSELPLQQLFLLNFAQNLMGEWNTGYLHQAVRNLKDFADIFNCPAYSILNSEIKCKIW